MQQQQQTTTTTRKRRKRDSNATQPVKVSDFICPSQEVKWKCHLSPNQPANPRAHTHTHASPATVARANGVRTNPKTTKPARRGAKGTASAHAALCETAPPPEPSTAQTCTPKGRTAGARSRSGRFVFFSHAWHLCTPRLAYGGEPPGSFPRYTYYIIIYIIQCFWVQIYGTSYGHQ